MSTIIEQIQELQQGIGPKRIKTPDVEVEQFDLKQLSDIAQKNAIPNPTFGTFKYTKAVPKDGCSCERE